MSSEFDLYYGKKGIEREYASARGFSVFTAAELFKLGRRYFVR